jgi:hypothetical protein
MAELTVNVVRIETVTTHPNADRLDLITLVDLGYQVISGRGNYEAGQLAFYFPIDAVIPEKYVLEFGISAYYNNRLRATKLRGLFSEGLLVPIDPYFYQFDPELKPGDDYTEFFGVTKYQPPVTIGQGKNPNPIGEERFPSPEHLKKYKGIFEEGEEVVITEKIHGCFPKNAKITMHDGTTKNICDIKTGDIVLGVDKDLTPIPTPVTNTFINGITDIWVKIQTKHTESPAINKNIVCTPNHQVYVIGRGYVEAQQLTTGDRLLTVTKFLVLNNIAKSVLIGKALGDGYINNKTGNTNISFGHKISHEEYLDYCLSLLGNLTSRTKHYRTSGYGSAIVASRSKNALCITKEFEKWFDVNTNKKIIPSDLVLDNLSLAIWYMDDGSLSHTELQQDRVNFASCAYSDVECNYLINALIKYGFNEPKLYKDNLGYNRIRLNFRDAKLLFESIKELVPECMQYKLPLEYRGNFKSPILPPDLYDYSTTSSIITGIETISSSNYPSDLSNSPYNKKYDIETETHNYFVSGSLVHNSNFSIHKDVDGNIKVASHNCFWDDTEENQKVPQIVLFHQSPEFLELPNNVIVYGEVYGSKIQDLTYGLTGIDYVLFAVSKEGVFLDYDDFVEFCNYYKLKRTPELYRGKYSYDVVQQFNNIDSKLVKNAQMSEGVCIIPVKERWDRSIQSRVCMKFVSDRYLLRKNGTENK